MRLNATIVLSLAMAIIGLAMIVRTIAAGGGPASLGIVLGTLLCALGAGRLFLARHG